MNEICSKSIKFRKFNNRQTNQKKVFCFMKILLISFVFGVFFSRLWAEEQNDIKKYIDSGNLFFSQKKYAEAAKWYEKAVKSDPNNPNAYAIWGLALANLGNYEDAISKYEKATFLDPKNVVAYNGWGVALDQLKKYEEASEKFQKAIELDNTGDPNLFEYYFNLASTLVHEGKFEDASQILKIGISLKPDFEPAHFMLGMVYSSLKEYSKSFSEYQRASELNPHDANIFLYWAATLGKSGEFDEVTIEKFKKVIEIEPKNIELTSQAYSGWAVTLHKMKRDKEAIKKFKKIIELNPNNTQLLSKTYMALGAENKILGNNSEAIEDFNKVIQLNNDPLAVGVAKKEILKMKD